MHSLYLLSVWLHILAAIIWIGGMFFVVLVIVPWLRQGERARAGALLRDTGIRFRNIGWSCFGVLAATGSFNLWMRGVRLGDFARSEWLRSPFGLAVVVKLLVFAGVLTISAIHDFRLGPQATNAIERDPNSREAERTRRKASFLGRINVVLALILVALAVIIVRGWP